MCSLANASAGMLMMSMIASAISGYVKIKLNGSEQAIKAMMALTRTAGMIVFAFLYPWTNVFLNVCCDGIRAKLICAK
jgi:hypothetical protein